MSREELQTPDFVVVKFGSSSVSSEQSGMNHDLLATYAEKIADLMADFRVVVTSSGAINTGKSMMGLGESLEDDADYAAIASADAFLAWQKSLGICGIRTAQVPVTNHEIDSIEGATLRESLIRLTGQNVVPIANGNDVLSHEGADEYKFNKDNDRLAAHIARLVGAKHLLLLTNEDGVINHREVPVHTVETTNDENLAISLAREGEGKRFGGDMRSKVKLAIEVKNDKNYDINVHIANANADYVDVINNQLGAGTHFPSRNF